MSEAHVDVPDPAEPKGFTIHAGNAVEMALRKAEKDREKRAELQLQRAKRAKAVIGDVVDNASLAADSTALNKKSAEDMADMIVKRMAKIVLLGGEGFIPVSLKEVTDSATAWSQIAHRETARRRAMALPEDEASSDAREVAKSLQQMRTKLKSVDKQTG